MEGIKGQTPFARFAAEALKQEPFTLIDVGCSSGIDDAWRVFGKNLRAFGFDPNIEDTRRLAANETLPGVSYVAAFVGVPSEMPGAARMQTGSFSDRSPWNRLSVYKTLQIRAKQSAPVDNAEKTRQNLWHDVPLADPRQPVILPAFLHDRDVDDVDFIKIDVDGADFLILRSIVPILRDMNVLGVGIEVNFHGSDDPDVHTLHNVDRLMKSNGFELFSLSVRPYSMAALPAPYRLTIPAQTAWGRILQGDALYLRDAAAPHENAWSAKARPEKILKLAALFSLASLPDCAAEVLLQFRAALQQMIDVDCGLDILTQESVSANGPAPTYRQYMAEFEAEAPRFWPALHPAVPLAQNGITNGETTEPKAQRLLAEINALKNSKSWRLTAPLRATAALIKQRMRKKA